MITLPVDFVILKTATSDVGCYQPNLQVIFSFIQNNTSILTKRILGALCSEKTRGKKTKFQTSFSIEDVWKRLAREILSPPL